MTPLSKGILLCLFSQLLFGVLYLFSHWMKPLGGTDVFALRMLTMAAGIWLMTLYSIGLPALGRFARKRLGTRRDRLLFAIGTANIGSQFWLFMWAPVNGEGVNVATGYFLFPLVMMLAGMLWLKERPNRLQLAALILAAAGVAHEIWTVRSFSWTTLWVCGMYPVYYLGRRKMNVPALQGADAGFDPDSALCRRIPAVAARIVGGGVAGAALLAAAAAAAGTVQRAGHVGQFEIGAASAGQPVRHVELCRTRPAVFGGSIRTAHAGGRFGLHHLRPDLGRPAVVVPKRLVGFQTA